MLGLKLAAAVSAMAFPTGAGALATTVTSPQIALAVLGIGTALGLIGLFSFADAEAAEEANLRAPKAGRFAPLYPEDGA